RTWSSRTARHAKKQHARRTRSSVYGATAVRIQCMRNVRVAMLGSGFVADFYMQGLANVNGHEVVVNYSRNLDHASAFAHRWSISESSTNLDYLIGRTDIDLFVIALPNDAHLPVSLALSKSARNQVCTKPLGRTRHEAKSM